ncbi:ligase-associated DNA damage response endonuclease PdeM [Algoriphagus sediminis]|uniref:Ligase-associated DNA damage response endonuclease PdeM n=1 Tax=Algoriphagus sediminis TaxID=3057113 RepID=A0ABT7YD72_9BACT|nr:ligase-associated DNA damage response endonuclease PdeM [Algoriphagus sediminis]MDN3204483.1 ligase-associated DNA damage response endonuclease PdeM [Algoriphagus sediminis]
MRTHSVQLNYPKFTLELLKEKVVWLQTEKILLIADLHFGKAAHFRKSGIPIPEPIHHQDLNRLNLLFGDFKPEAVYFLGDIFHSDVNDQWKVLNNFLGSFRNIEFHLILGNHDILSEDFYSESCFTIHKRPLEIIDGLFLSHEPLEILSEEKFNICGHIHPGVRMRGRARQSINLPCFYLNHNQLILPAFGIFTGLYTITPTNGERVFGVTPERVIELKSE